MRPEILAIVPARGGSKGILRKNVRPFAGKPLLAHSLEHLKQAGAVTRIVVSTDDDEIASVAEAWGAEVVRRPEAISGDSATSESALLHVLDHLKQTEEYEPELVVFLQATSPLRGGADVAGAIETLQREGADSLFSACHVEGFTWRSSAEGVEPIGYDPTKRPRRQELSSEVLEENGSIYVFKPWVLRELGSRLGGKIATWRMPRLDSFQIDVPEDWEMLEKLSGLGRSTIDLDLLVPIRLLIFDFDGVMTDNRVWVDQEGREGVFCHRGDGWGLAQLKRAGLEMMVISTEANPVVARRCAKLRIGCIQNCPDKLVRLRELVAARSLTPGQVAYVGNDVNDLDCLRWVGVPIAVADAWPEAIQAARLVTSRVGGQGAVREVADWFLAARRRAAQSAEQASANARSE